MDRQPVILVVDDDVPIIILMRSLLREFGFQAVTAPDGQEAIKAVQEARPDLILLDKNMPGLTCAEAIRGIRQHETAAPILILSGEPIESGELTKLGADAAILKPFDVQALIEQIRSYVGKSV